MRSAELSADPHQNQKNGHPEIPRSESREASPEPFPTAANNGTVMPDSDHLSPYLNQTIKD